MRQAKPLPLSLSHSQLSTYIQCGEKYRLERLYGLPQSLWWSTAFGTAMHEMTEQHDRGVNVERFEDHLDRALAVEQAKANNIPRPSGNVRKATTWNGGPGKRDRAWCLELGPQVFESYLRWRDATGWPIAEAFDMDAGEFVPAIELGWEATLGGVPVRGFVDRVFEHPDKGPLIVDLKFGARGPSGVLQLKAYRVGLSLDWGIEARHGMFLSPYIPKEADDDRPEMGGRIDPLDPGEDAYTEHLYRMARVGMEGGVFLPNTDTCNMCAVTEWCRAKGGLAVGEVPIREDKE